MNLKNKRNIYFSYYFVKFKHGREDNHVNSTRYHSKEYKILSNYIWFQNRVFVKKDNEGVLKQIVYFSWKTKILKTKVIW